MKITIVSRIVFPDGTVSIDYPSEAEAIQAKDRYEAAVIRANNLRDAEMVAA